MFLRRGLARDGVGGHVQFPGRLRLRLRIRPAALVPAIALLAYAVLSNEMPLLQPVSKEPDKEILMRWRPFGSSSSSEPVPEV